MIENNIPLWFGPTSCAALCPAVLCHVPSSSFNGPGTPGSGGAVVQLLVGEHGVLADVAFRNMQLA